MEKLTFSNEYNQEINYIIGAGYYLKDETLANDELMAHTEFTSDLFEKGLHTKEVVTDADILELVGFNAEENTYYAQWYNTENGESEYINFQ